MNNKTKYLIISTMAVIILLMLVVSIIMLLNPLRKSEAKIRKDLLEKTPIGMNMEDVIKIINKNKNWELEYIEKENGYIVISGRPSEPSPEEIKSGNTIGQQSIRVYLGGYRTIIWADVVVFFAFDEEGKLIDIAVRKDYDSI